MAAFRIAQISDLHFGYPFEHQNPVELAVRGKAGVGKGAAAIKALRKPKPFAPSTFSPDVAQTLLRTLSGLLGDLDAIVATGDLATTGDDAALALARGFFGGAVPAEWNPIGGLPSLLAHSEDIVVCLPGNHDRYADKWLSPGSQNFENHFGPFWDFDRDKSYEVSGSSPRVRVCALQIDNAQLFLCLADFSLNERTEALGTPNWIGQGRVAADTLDDLSQTTKILLRHAQAAGREAGAIWAVHFPPSYPDIAEDLELLEAEHLVEAAKLCGVNAILAGHTHKALQYQASADVAVTVLCCGATTGLSDHDEFAFSVLDIAVEKAGLTISPTNYVWSKETREFAVQPYPVA